MYVCRRILKHAQLGAVLLCAVFALPPVAAQTTPTAGQAIPGLEAFDDAMLALLTKNNYPGATLAVAYKGKLVLDKAYGFAKKGLANDTPMAAGQRMRLASLSKWITAAAALKAAEQGKLDLDKPIVQLLGFSENPADYADARVTAITLRQLLQNHAGWMIDRNNDPMFERSPPCPNSAARWLSAQKLQTDPGQLYSYSNLNFCLAQLAIEKASGQKYTDFVLTQIAAPAGIKSWEFATLRGKADEPEYTANSTDRISAYLNLDFESLGGAGAWTSSAADYLRFMVAQRWQMNGSPMPLLSAASIAQLSARPAAAASATAAVYYGLGVNARPVANGEVNVFHSGSLPGTSSYAVSYANGWSLVAIFNGRVASDIRDASVAETGRRLSDAISKSGQPAGEIRPF